MGFFERVRKSWNAFRDSEDNRLNDPFSSGFMTSTATRRGSGFGSIGGDARTILNTIKTKIALDVANVEFRHARLTDDGDYASDIKSKLNGCFVRRANIDQGPQQFRRDIALTLFDEGTIAIVPTMTTTSPRNGNSYDIEEMRVGTVVGWAPRSVTVRCYDDRDEVGGQFRDITLSKEFVAIVENPLYMIMNEPNSILQRLTQKLQMLDSVDAYASSGRMDLIIQLPYVVKSEAKQAQATKRRDDMEAQLRDSKYGVAYIDGTERITQLNRPVENNLLKQIESLQSQLYAQLGLSPAIFDGTADEAAMLNYQNRTIKPIVREIAEKMRMSFLTETAVSQGQSIEYFSDPFELVPIADIAEIADKFTRNEILSANEIRSIVGRKPSADPKANELRNSNMPAPEDSGLTDIGELPDSDADPEDSALGEIDAEITAILASLEEDSDT